VPWVSRLDEGSLRAIAGPQMLLLRTPAPLRGEDLTTVSEFSIEAGQRIPFVLTNAPSHLPAPDSPDPIDALAQTERFWNDWSATCKEAGRWSDAVRRSLITLKALTSRQPAESSQPPPHHCGKSAHELGLPLLFVRDATLTLLCAHGRRIFPGGKRVARLAKVNGPGSPEQMQIM
jgi:hypothetical protein